MILPILHGGGGGPFLTSWNVEPAVAAGLVLAAGAYAIALRRTRETGRPVPPQWQVVAYYGGLVSVLIALLGPLDTFNDEYFFLHMLQHLVLMQVAAPLILLGRPVQVFLRGLAPRYEKPILRAVLRPRGTRWALTLLSTPLVGFVLFNASMIVWHIPAFYDAALVNDRVHDLEHLSFFATGLLFWWPIIDPVPRHHKAPVPWALGMIFFSMLIGSALGAVLTLASGVIYPFYLTAANPWGISALTDQQIGGLIMWVGGGLIYMGILLGMLALFLNRETAAAETHEWAEANESPGLTGRV